MSKQILLFTLPLNGNAEAPNFSKVSSKSFLNMITPPSYKTVPFHNNNMIILIYYVVKYIKDNSFLPFEIYNSYINKKILPYIIFYTLGTQLYICVF